MPAYINNPQTAQVVALYPGESLSLVNNAATDSGITKTIQFAVGPIPGNGTSTLVFVNSTNQDATLKYAANEIPYPGSTQPVYEPLPGGTVSAGTALSYNMSGGWVLATFGTAPTSGSLTVSR